MTTGLTHAKLTWQHDDSGKCVPISEQFDDVYFSHAGGLAETDYVFLQGNQLPERFAQLRDYECFVIGETGFGTGLNFLATCKLWKKYANPKARLQFISTEKFPLSAEDMARALQSWHSDENTPWIEAILENYPLALTGCHRLHITDNITLDLWFGDALASFNSLNQASDWLTHTTHAPKAKVDAWFLDGFAPSKNSDLWSVELFEQFAKLSHASTTLATFTAAGFVRRALIQVGFRPQKIKGFGRKREMLIANFCGTISKPTTARQHIAIIGGGISGMMCAYALARRGHRISVIDKNPPMRAASGNPRALFAPKLTLIERSHEHLPTVSFLYAHRIYTAMTKDAQKAIFEPVGVMDFLLPSKKSVQKRSEQIQPFPDALIHQLNTDEYPDDYRADFMQADIVAHSSMSGLLNPALICDYIRQLPRVEILHQHITHIQETDTQVQLHTDTQEILADAVIISAGYESEKLDESLFVCRKIRGQLSWVNLDKPNDTDTAIKYDGYCAFFKENQQSKLLFGASFVRNCTQLDIQNEEHQFNRDKLQTALPTLAERLPGNADFSGKVGIRAQTPDYHPLVGKIPNKNHSYTLYGMGSKGFSFAPICAEILADTLDGTPLPVTQALLAKLAPNRPRLQTPLSD